MSDKSYEIDWTQLLGLTLGLYRDGKPPRPSLRLRVAKFLRGLAMRSIVFLNEALVLWILWGWFAPSIPLSYSQVAAFVAMWGVLFMPAPRRQEYTLSSQCAYYVVGGWMLLVLGSAVHFAGVLW